MTDRPHLHLVTNDDTELAVLRGRVNLARALAAHLTWRPEDEPLVQEVIDALDGATIDELRARRRHRTP